MRKVLLALLLGVVTAAAAPRPRLVVVISVDQFSAELMERWGKDLPGGLGRLRREGTAFLAAYHDHGLTATAPGHAVLLSGRNPCHTGIPENTWFDRTSGKWVYCVQDPASPLVGSRDGKGYSAKAFHGTTLGMWLQDQIPGGRSWALTGKDRSAILMAGPRAQGVYWFEDKVGFSTSTAYAATLPAWLAAWNGAFLAGLDGASLDWNPMDAREMPPAATYLIHGRPLVLGLPRLLQAVGMARDEAFWGRYKASPFFDEAILDAAQALVDGEDLGRGPGTDLLALGLSATDFVGHAFGTGGPEMFDQIHRMDRRLGAFLDHVQARVPEVWVILTADHGAADMPERLQAMGIPARRLDLRTWQTEFNEALSRRLKVSGRLFRAGGAHDIYLDDEVLKASGLDRAAVLRAAAETARAMPDVAGAWTADELEALRVDPQEPPQQRSLEARLRLSCVKGRSGDLFLAFQPMVMAGGGDPLEHGHPYDYDRRVPLVFWGPWKAETRREPVRTVDLAPTLARELGLVPAEELDGRALDLHPRNAGPGHTGPLSTGPGVAR
jgi:predicted AlkP superfamily pyrophosphatase or phosphodiesterase